MNAPIEDSIDKRRRIPFYFLHYPIPLDQVPDNRTSGLFLLNVIVLGFYYCEPHHRPTRYAEALCLILFGYAFELIRDDSEDSNRYNELIRRH